VLLDLVLQIGPCRIEPVGRRLLRVRGGSDQPAIVAATKRAGGERDGTQEFWWIEARNLRAFADELERVSDPLLRECLFHLWRSDASNPRLLDPASTG
jgi:hypothetical protein